MVFIPGSPCRQSLSSIMNCGRYRPQVALASRQKTASHIAVSWGDAMNVSSTKRPRADIDMRAFAKSAGATIKVPAGGVVFSRGEAGDCMYIVQSGVIEMVIGDKVIE